MALQVVALLLVLGITFMQSIFGFFSGLINVFCTIVSVAVAFGFYEPLNGFVVRQFELHSGYTEPIILFLLFVITLSLLRAAADNLIRGNVHVPMYLDWGGAGVCGFVNAQLCVGMMVICTLMLPLGGTVMQFSRYERTEDPNPDHSEMTAFERNRLWFRSDEFTVGLFNMLSKGSLKKSTAFSSVYPSFTDSVFFSTNTVQPESSPAVFIDKKIGDGTKGLTVETWWEQKQPLPVKYREEPPTERERTPAVKPITFKAAPGMKLLGARLAVPRAAADRDRSATVHLFRPTMIRLVGVVGDGQPYQAPARVIGGVDEFITFDNRLVDYDTNFRMSADGEERLDAYFEVPEDFRPRFVEYRRHARAPMNSEPAKEAPALALKAEASAHKAAGDVSGNRTFGTVLEAGSNENTGLPAELNAEALRTQGGNVKLAGDRIVACRISGPVSRFKKAGEDSGIKDFAVPEGYRMLQIRYRPKTARSLAGQVFNYVGRTVNQYVAIDDRGNPNTLDGYFAIVKRNGEEHIELFFNGPKDAPDKQIDPAYKYMMDFKYLKPNEINDGDDVTVGLIFLVKPGVVIKRIENQAHDGGDVEIKMSGP